MGIVSNKNEKCSECETLVNDKNEKSVDSKLSKQKTVKSFLKTVACWPVTGENGSSAVQAAIRAIRLDVLYYLLTADGCFRMSTTKISGKPFLSRTQIENSLLMLCMARTNNPDVTDDVLRQMFEFLRQIANLSFFKMCWILAHIGTLSWTEIIFIFGFEITVPNPKRPQWLTGENISIGFTMLIVMMVFVFLATLLFMVLSHRSVAMSFRQVNDTSTYDAIRRWAISSPETEVDITWFGHYARWFNLCRIGDAQTLAALALSHGNMETSSQIIKAYEKQCGGTIFISQEEALSLAFDSDNVGAILKVMEHFQFPANKLCTFVVNRAFPGKSEVNDWLCRKYLKV